MTTPTDDLIRKMWITKSARFAAAKRITAQKTASVVSNSLISLSIIGISIFVSSAPELFDRLGGAKYLSISAIIGSVSIIILSLLQELRSARENPETMHTCARDILTLHDRYLYEDNKDPALLGDYNKKYQDILNRCPFNHEGVDHLTAKLDDPAQFSISGIRLYYLRLKRGLWYFKSVWGLGLIFITIAIISFYLAYLIHP